MRNIEFYRTVIANIPQTSLFIFDRDFICLNAEGSDVREFFGDQDITGKNFNDFFPAELMGMLNNVHEKVFQGIASSTEVDFQGQHYKNTYFPLVDGNIIAAGILFSQNITKQKIAESRLLKSRNIFRGLADIAPCSIMISRKIREKEGMQVFYVNLRWLEQIGYSNEEIPDLSTWYEKAFPDENYRKKIIDEWSIENNEVENRLKPLTVKVLCKNGQYKWFTHSESVIDNYHISVYLDITKEKEDNFRFEQIYNSIQEGLWETKIPENGILDDDSYTWSSPNLLEMLGYTEEEFKPVSGSWNKLIHPDYQKRVNEVYDQLMNGDLPDDRYEIQNFVKSKSGKYIYFSERAKLLRDDNGKPTLIVGVVTDISEKKKMEENLHSTIEELRAIEEELRQQTEELSAINENLEGTKIELEETLAKEQDIIKELHLKEEELEQQQEDLMAANEYMATLSAQLEKVLIRERKSKEKLAQKTEDLNKQKKRLKETLKELQLAQDQLVQSEKIAALGVLVAGVAHEINNPVNYISSSSEGLKIVFSDLLEIIQEYEKITPENVAGQLEKIQLLKNQYEYDELIKDVAELTDNIHEGANKTAEIVRGLRTFARTDDNYFQVTDIHPLIDSTLIVLYNTYKRNIEIEKMYSNLPVLRCYPNKLSQLFINIFSNAIDAINEKSTNISGKISIKTYILKKGDANWAVIEVTDNGVGMNKKMQEHIFEPFFTTKEVGKGSGLGLPISLGIVESHNGKIEISSELGKGTTIFIHLPID